MFNLGYCYNHGQGVEKDISKAVGLYQQAADMGNPLAINNLGRCYEYGEGVEKDISKAVELYQRAADMGNSAAMNGLGDCYYYGQGVEKDLSKAIELYKKSCDMDNKEALQNLYHLADVYEHGYDEIERNYKKAFDLYVYTYEKGLEKVITKIYQDKTFSMMYMVYLSRKELTENINTLRGEMKDLFNSLLYMPGMRGAIEAHEEFNQLLKDPGE